MYLSYHVALTKKSIISDGRTVVGVQIICIRWIQKEKKKEKKNSEILTFNFLDCEKY